MIKFRSIIKKDIKVFKGILGFSKNFQKKSKKECQLTLFDFDQLNFFDLKKNIVLDKTLKKE